MIAKIWRRVRGPIRKIPLTLANKDMMKFSITPQLNLSRRGMRVRSPERSKNIMKCEIKKGWKSGTLCTWPLMLIISLLNKMGQFKKKLWRKIETMILLEFRVKLETKLGTMVNLTRFKISWINLVIPINYLNLINSPLGSSSFLPPKNMSYSKPKGIKKSSKNITMPYFSNFWMRGL